ncbi:hypothetical protein ABMA27_003218 [Loxostege sticticalis]|uniref:Uncharacterized protein n=1 Tax=Loxostege sticticalis TaxID=481309 RepID=A0ABR3HSJ0_LOXSC
MKIDLLSVSIFFVVTISIVEAQRYTKFNKPIIDLNRKPQVTTTPRLPEERRKLSIFPKSMVKYVVTSKPYAKVRTYSPYQVTTKRPVMQKLVPEQMKSIRTMASARTPIMKYDTMTTTTPKRQFSPRFQFTTKPPVEQMQQQSNFYETEDNYIKSPSTRYNVAFSSENNLSSFDEKDYEGEGKKADKELATFSSTDKTEHVGEETIDLEAVESNDSGKRNVDKTMEQANKEEDTTTVKVQTTYKHTTDEAIKEDNQMEEDKEDAGEEPVIKASETSKAQNAETQDDEMDSMDPEYDETENSESENNRKKRLSILGRGVYNNILVIENKPAKEDSDTASEMKDRNEFIFIKDYLKVPVDLKKSSTENTEIDDSVEIATEIAWLEEYNPRQERSINIIEEENLGTTVSGFKFTGKSDPRVDSHLLFKNINA